MAVFGVPLSQTTPDLPYPRLVEDVLTYIHDSGSIGSQGIFRLSGSATQISKLKAKYDRGEQVNLRDDCTDPNVATGLLKLFLRELPDPLLTYDLYSVFISTLKAPDEDMRKRHIKATVCALPIVNVALLKTLTSFLLEVSKHASDNQMHVPNLATVIGPNIMKLKEENMLSMVKDTGKVNAITAYLINHHDYIFSESQDGVCALATTLYAYAAQSVNEISFKENDVIFVTELPGNDGWSQGETAMGAHGLYPSDYATIIAETGMSPQNNSVKAISQQESSYLETISELNEQLRVEIVEREKMSEIIKVLSNSLNSLKIKANSLESANVSLKAEVDKIRVIADKNISSDSIRKPQCDVKANFDIDEEVNNIFGGFDEIHE